MLIEHDGWSIRKVLCAWFQASVAVHMKSALLWDFPQYKRVVTDVSSQPIGPIFEGQAVQEECREYLGMQLFRGWWFFSQRTLEHPPGNTSFLPSTSFKFHQPCWLASRSLRTNPRPHHSLYYCIPKVFPAIDWDCLILEGGTDRLFRNVGGKLPIYAAYHRIRAQVSRFSLL